MYDQSYIDFTNKQYKFLIVIFNICNIIRDIKHLKMKTSKIPKTNLLYI